MSKDKKLKVVKLDCCLCGDEIDTQVTKSGPDKVIWTDGHNAEPMAKGRCCNYCNDTKVIPARIKSIQQGGLTSGDKQYFENEHHFDIETARNNLIDLQDKLNKSMMKEVDEDG